ncbi:tRNA guanosine(34) transglycosylase Tgt [candidate division KSB1 bacterium]|nr:tRNA guanosine(34) transglycosylase Tgt [candidate division KSB1 bacterium]
MTKTDEKRDAQERGVFFRLLRRDKHSSARAGILSTAHGDIPTPIFMPVGTQATVKTLTPAELHEIGARIILSNTYHLYLRPGAEIVRGAGGLQKFSSWHAPILTDSGGFQIFSLAELNKIDVSGFTFRSHLDGSQHFLTPENVISIQRDLGSDIMMVLDECVPYPCEYRYAKKSTELTLGWARKSLQAVSNYPPVHGYAQYPFAIVQGSVYEDLRRYCALELCELDFPGYAIGGLSVGEPKEALYDLTELCAAILPPEKPRYLMGVGKPEDLVEGIERGIDMFDCIIPTRNGRNGTVFTSAGPLNIKSARYKRDPLPLDPDCACMTCQIFSRAYLRHLFNAKELLVLRLLSYHNVFFYLDLVTKARKAILGERYSTWKRDFLLRYTQNRLDQ